VVGAHQPAADEAWFGMAMASFMGIMRHMGVVIMGGERHLAAP
jgi:hypothetical protein